MEDYSMLCMRNWWNVMEKLHKICSNKVDLDLFVVLKHAREHVLSLRAILDNLLISIGESINPVITNLLYIPMFVHKQVNMSILPNYENEPCRVAATENENKILHTEHKYTEKQSRMSDNFGR